MKRPYSRVEAPVWRNVAQWRKEPSARTRSEPEPRESPLRETRNPPLPRESDGSAREEYSRETASRAREDSRQLFPPLRSSRDGSRT